MTRFLRLKLDLLRRPQTSNDLQSAPGVNQMQTLKLKFTSFDQSHVVHSRPGYKATCAVQSDVYKDQTAPV